MPRIIPENSTPIINEIIEKLACTRLSTYEFNVIFAIIRKTYGWDKSKDAIKNKHLVGLTGMQKQHVNRTLKKLIQRKVVAQAGYNFGINRYTEQWTELPKQATSSPSRLPSSPSRLPELPKQATNNGSAKDTNKRYLIKESYVRAREVIKKFNCKDKVNYKLFTEKHPNITDDRLKEILIEIISWREGKKKDKVVTTSQVFNWIEVSKKFNKPEKNQQTYKPFSGKASWED